MYVLAMYFKLVQENAYVWMVTKCKRDVSYRQNLDIWVHKDPWNSIMVLCTSQRIEIYSQ